MVLEQSFLDEVQATLPELPTAKKQRFESEFKLSTEDAGILTADRETADFFEKTVNATKAEAKIVSNWMMGELFANLKKSELEISDSPINTDQFALLLDRIADNTLSGKTAKQVFAALWEQEGDVDAIIEAKGLKQITDTGAIEAIVDEVIANCPEQVEQFKDGNDKVIGFLVGQVMQKSKGKANPQMANQMLKEKMS